LNKRFYILKMVSNAGRPTRWQVRNEAFDLIGIYLPEQVDQLARDTGSELEPADIRTILLEAPAHQIIRTPL